MSFLSGNYKRGYFGLGPIIQVVIMQPLKPVPPFQRGRRDSPLERPHFFGNALLDTGATGTCISQKVIEQVKLEPTGLRTITSASETSEKREFSFSVGVLFANRKDPDTNQVSGTGHVFQIEGVEFHVKEPSKFDVLLGMDVIGRGSLKLDGDGHFSFCL